MKTQLLNALKVFALALVLSFGMSYAFAWTAPAATPPGGNVVAPINTSATAQIKAGPLTVGSIISGSSTTTKLSIMDTISGITTGLNVAPFYVPASTYTYGYCTAGNGYVSSCGPGPYYRWVSGTGTNPAYGGTTFNAADSNGTVRNLALQTNTGNVGIGTNNPPNKLTVAGTIGATGDICTSTTGSSICLGSLPVAASHGNQLFTSSGTFTVPSGVTKVLVSAVGKGGKGGTNGYWSVASGGALAAYGGGGGGGETVMPRSITVTPGDSYAVYVGNAASVDSSFEMGVSPYTKLLVAKMGGAGGNSYVTYSFNTATGKQTSTLTIGTGGAGGNSGTLASGASGTAGTTSSAGVGGASFVGQAGSAGFVGSGYGGGGGSDTFGAPGFVVVEW